MAPQRVCHGACRNTLRELSTDSGIRRLSQQTSFPPFPRGVSPMKRQVILSLVAAAILFAVSSTQAHAGMFGRLGHVFHRGCGPCAPACEPCEQTSEPCPPACLPCEPGCDVACDAPCRPFNGFFARMKAKWAARHCNACGPCEPACDPCEAACEPCEPACDPCAPGCDVGCAPCRPFAGFVAKWKAFWATKRCNPCNPCDPCDPCEPACEPCQACK